MKKTEYFTSSHQNYNEFSKALVDAKQKRDTFLSNNIDSIEEIVEEKLYPVPTSANTIYAVISISYFEKPKQ